MSRFLMALFAGFLSCSFTSAADEPVIGGPCEGCENVFVGMPEDPNFSARIAPRGEPGEPLVITGTVRTQEGKPVPGIIVQ